jgi:hypothetical protein
MNIQASSSSSVSRQQGVPASDKNCYKCGLPGHGVKDCKTVLFCIYCRKTTYISGNYVLPSQPKHVAALIGGGLMDYKCLHRSPVRRLMLKNLNGALR